MIVLRYDKVELPVVNSNYDIEKSSQEVTFSDITCDFTDRDKSELPEKYQEIKIYDNDKDVVKFIGYLDSFDLGEMREVDVDRNINITLMSPMKLATLRTVVAVGTYNIKDLIEKIFQPLIDDGFEIAELNISNRSVSVNYVVQTVEYCMSDLSNSYNIWWFIDELKKIYIRDIDIMLRQQPSLIYDDKDTIPGLQYLKPTISSDGYANVVNVKNVRIYEYSRMLFAGKTIEKNINGLLESQISSIKNGETINLLNPVDTTKVNVKKSADSNNITEDDIYAIYCTGTFTDNSNFQFYIKYNVIDDSYVFSDNLGFDGVGDDKEFLLIKDSFFSNLVTSIKYSGDKTIKQIDEINSDSILVYNIIKVYNDSAISEKAGKISDSGIVEYTLDLNEQWKTVQEVKDIASAYIDKNSIEFDGSIEAVTDKDVFSVGDVVEINKMMFDGKYVVTSIRETCSNNDENYTVTLNNTSNVDNYIDLFRNSTSQTNSDETSEVTILHYSEEKFEEIHEVVQ